MQPFSSPFLGLGRGQCAQRGDEKRKMNEREFYVHVHGNKWFLTWSLHAICWFESRGCVWCSNLYFRQDFFLFFQFCFYLVILFEAQQFLRRDVRQLCKLQVRLIYFLTLFILFFLIFKQLFDAIFVFKRTISKPRPDHH